MTAIDRLLPSPSAAISDEELSTYYDSTASAKPWLRANFVTCADGSATASGLSAGLSGHADKRLFELLRRVADVVIVGAGTVRAEGYGPMRVSEESAAWRVARGRPAHPVFVIVSGSLDLDAASDIFTDAPVRPIVVTTASVSPEIRAPFEAVADVIVAGQHSVDAREMVDALVSRGYTALHCEGGPTLFASLLDAGVVDELCLTVSPLLVGGDSGRIVRGLVDTSALDLAQVLVSDGVLMLRYLIRGRA